VSDTVDVLERARLDTGLTMTELWFRYFAVGGMSTALEIDAYLYGALVATPHNRDLLAVALNERFFELGLDHPVAYSNDREIDGD